LEIIYLTIYSTFQLYLNAIMNRNLLVTQDELRQNKVEKCYSFFFFKA